VHDAPPPSPALDRPRDGDGPGWRDTFDLTFASPRGTFGGHITIVRWPAERRCWYWASVVGATHPVVTVVETAIALPADRGLELRAPGIWADQVCESPWEHWSYGLEAFGIGLTDADELVEATAVPSPGGHLDVWGDRVPVGFDLEWEASGPAGRQAGGYAQAGIVHGEVLVGREAYELDGAGVRFRAAGRSAPLALVDGVDLGEAPEGEGRSRGDRADLLAGGGLGPTGRTGVCWREPTGPTWRIGRVLLGGEPGPVGWRTTARVALAWGATPSLVASAQASRSATSVTTRDSAPTKSTEEVTRGIP
jgi:hypothetical protein